MPCIIRVRNVDCNGLDGACFLIFFISCMPVRSNLFVSLDGLFRRAPGFYTEGLFYPLSMSREFLEFSILVSKLEKICRIYAFIRSTCATSIDKSVIEINSERDRALGTLTVFVCSPVSLSSRTEPIYLRTARFVLLNSHIFRPAIIS